MELLKRLLMCRHARCFHRVQVPSTGASGRAVGVAIKNGDTVEWILESRLTRLDAPSYTQLGHYPLRGSMESQNVIEYE